MKGYTGTNNTEGVAPNQIAFNWDDTIYGGTFIPAGTGVLSGHSPFLPENHPGIPSGIGPEVTPAGLNRTRKQLPAWR